MSALVQIGGKASTAPQFPVPHDKWRGVRPRQVQMYVENNCHLRCEHCYESEETHPTHSSHSSGVSHGSLSLDDYDVLLGQLAALGGLFITITGGEIFLRRDVLDVVALARKHRFAVTLYTSGTLIDERIADRIRDLKVSEVHISIYSHDAATHDAFTHSPRSHERSLRAVRLLKERGITVVLKANVLRANIDHLDELLALADRLGTDIQLDPHVRPRMNGDTRPVELGVPTDELMRKVLVRPDLSPSFRRLTAEQLCTGDRSLLDDDDVMCSAGRNVVSVGADGTISACGFFPVAAGTWRRGASLEDIWLGSAQLDAVREMSMGKMHECPTCDVRSTCNPCMAYGVVEHGDIGACNSTSKRGATAFRELAELKVRANEKMARGRALPLVGDTKAVAAPARQARNLLATEP